MLERKTMFSNMTFAEVERNVTHVLDTQQAEKYGPTLAFLLTEFSRVVDIVGESDELSVQIDELSVQIDELKDLNNTLEKENEKLSVQIDELSDINGDLTSDVADLRRRLPEYYV